MKLNHFSIQFCHENVRDYLVEVTIYSVSYVEPRYPGPQTHELARTLDHRFPPMATNENRRRYWKKNLHYLGILLTIWFVVSFCCGILFVEQLDTIRVGGFKLGFWFAQQGSIYVFVVLIFVYVFLMNRLDKRFNVDEQRPTGSGEAV